MFSRICQLVLLIGSISKWRHYGGGSGLKQGPLNFGFLLILKPTIGKRNLVDLKRILLMFMHLFVEGCMRSLQ
jgi:hypothetical protein